MILPPDPDMLVLGDLTKLEMIQIVMMTGQAIFDYFLKIFEANFVAFLELGG